MSTCININGVVTPPQEAKISVLDHGLLFGDSVYETMRTYNGQVFLFSRHFERLEHSAAGIELNLPWSKSATCEQVKRTLVPGESRIRLMVTRGMGTLVQGAETCTDPSVIIIVVPLVALPRHVYEEGVAVAMSTLRRGGRFADIKTGSLIHQVMARREANSKGVFEAILLTADGKVSDGIASNVYMIRDGCLLTPSRDAAIVEGITRRVVLDLAKESGITVVEGIFDQSDILTADEMFLTSTTREIVPVRTLDGRAVGSGKPGPITRMLTDAYRAAIVRLASEE